MTDLTTKTSPELVILHNSLNPDKPLKSWNSRKAHLITRIEALQAKADKEQEAENRRKAKEARDPNGPTIRDVSLEWLCKAAFFEDKTKKSSPENHVSADHPSARSVGFSYYEILDEVKKAFPYGKTSAACLRWYAVKIRVEEEGFEGHKLPQRRPRASPAKN